MSDKKSVLSRGNSRCRPTRKEGAWHVQGIEMTLGRSDCIGETKSEIRAVKALQGRGKEFGKVGSLWGILKAGK